MDTPYGNARFPTTHWSLVGRAAQDASEAKRRALDELLARYQPALRAHLIYGKRLQPEDAEDLLQEFVACKILASELFAGRCSGRQVPHLPPYGARSFPH